ncbi:hypothetical protein HMPREF1199_01382 [Hoylesella oralis CC98A]|nr:hypothetical protein HMPREF1199_01382 [Hoylesella oralis CC98A]
MDGGLKLRNRFFKGNILSKNISLKCNDPNAYAIFEEFMDYLSTMQLGIIDSDKLVLNSVSNFLSQTGVFNRKFILHKNTTTNNFPRLLPWKVSS